MNNENISNLREIGINLKGIANALRDTDDHNEIQDLKLSLEQNFDLLKDIMIKEDI